MNTNTGRVHISRTAARRPIAALTSKTGNVNAFQRLFYFFILFSFLGYIGEISIFPFYYHHFKQWQGPLHGPWLTLYGFGGLALIVLLGQLRNRKIMLGRINIMPVFVFILGFFTVSVVEFVGSWILDVGFGVTLWDYSTEPFNIQGRICLVNSLAFAAVGTALLWFVVPLVQKHLANLTARANKILFGVVFGAFALDIVYSFGIILLGRL
ncbi:MAG: putative ABC transporter permease [Coriobacteriia bacterium]|nr:putative ABC transporter permease [Coriobacteriia bacterium]